MNNYCFDLHLPVNHPLTNPSILKWDHENEPSSWFCNHSDISSEFTKFLDSLGLVMTYPILIFYTPANQDIPIHIDGIGISDRFVMNWCVGGFDSQMQWYTLKDNNITEAKITTAGTPYTRYALEQVDLVHTQTVKWPSMVQTGIPHRITNYGPEKRWALSCDVSLKSAPEAGLTFKQAMEIFKPWM
jgi:hypothetical protein